MSIPVSSPLSLQGTIATGALAQSLFGSLNGGSGLVVGTPVIAPNNGIIGVGQLLAIPVTNGGSGYEVPPLISISGGGGNGARATAVISGGVVTGINIVAGGGGFTSPPTVSFANPGFSSGNNFLIQNTNASGNLYLCPDQNAGPHTLAIIPGQIYVAPYRTSSNVSIYGSTGGMTFYLETW